MDRKVIQTNRVYSEVKSALSKSFQIISAQGGSSSGKTRNIMIFLCLYLLQTPGKRATVVRREMPTLRTSVLVDFIVVMEQLGYSIEEGFARRLKPEYRFPNGSMIEFVGMNDEQKARGARRNILFCNEANEIHPIVWEQLKMRTDEFIIVDYNPSFGDEHWINKLNRQEGVYHFRTTYRDNPFVAQSVIDTLESYKERNPRLWQVYGLGEPGVIEGLIYTNWQTGYMPNDTVTWYGVDWGWNPDPTAVVAVSYCPKRNMVWLREVMYQTEATTFQVAEAIKRDYRQKETLLFRDDKNEIIYQSGILINGIRYGKDSKEYADKIRSILNDVESQRVYKEVKDIESASVLAYCDHAGDRIAELRHYGIRSYKARKGKNSVVDQINWITLNVNVTYQGRNIERELKTYVRKRDRSNPDIYLPEPEDGNDHLMDAARYGIYTGLTASASTFKAIANN